MLYLWRDNVAARSNRDRKKAGPLGFLPVVARLAVVGGKELGCASTIRQKWKAPDRWQLAMEAWQLRTGGMHKNGRNDGELYFAGPASFK